MKMINKHCEVLASFDREGNVKPHTIKLTDEEGMNREITIHKRSTPIKEKFNGSDYLVFKCQVIINGLEKILELKFSKKDTTWILWKM